MSDLVQGSPQWVKQRIGWCTASRMNDVVAVLKSGKPIGARTRYMMDLVAERMTDVATTHYVTAAMQHGIDNEAPAADAYEEATGELLLPASFVQHPTIEYFGATPDRLLGADGLVEIKCPSTATFVSWRASGVVPDEHKAQMIAQLACTRRAYCDFVAFDPRVQEPALQLFVRRFEPTPAEIEAIEEAARQFLAEVDALFTRVVQSP